MPKFAHLFLIATFYTATLLLPSSARASTDPQTATVSATAHVPSALPTTADTTAPPPVILISPVDGATTNQSKPEFVWVQTFDSNSNVVYYTVLINGVSTYLGVSNTGNTAQYNYISHLGDGRVYLTPLIDLPEGEYNWVVLAQDGSGNTSYSASWHFTVDQTAPVLSLVDINNQYHNPSLSEDSIFDLDLTDPVTLTFVTEPWATVSVSLSLPDSSVESLSIPTSSSGIAQFKLTLPLGLTKVSSSSFDHAGLTTTLPTFQLNLVQPKGSGFTGLIPPLSLPQIKLQPFTAYQNIPSLTATVSQITSNNLIAIAYISLLAVVCISLLILLLKPKYNLILIDSLTNQPYRSLIVYHSRPTPKSHKPQQLTFRLRPIDKGRLYIPRLGRGSTLTLTYANKTITTLSLCVEQKSYTITA